MPWPGAMNDSGTPPEILGSAHDIIPPGQRLHAYPLHNARLSSASPVVRIVNPPACKRRQLDLRRKIDYILYTNDYKKYT